MDRTTKINILKRRINDFHDFMLETIQDGIGEDLEFKDFIEMALETYLDIEQLQEEKSE